MPDPSPEQAQSPSSPHLIPDERVHAALRRAAQLQVEAAERLEYNARARIQEHSGDESDAGGYLREHVEAAAVEAGISPEYIHQALLEQEALGEHAVDLAPWVDQLGNRMLGTRQRSIELSRMIAAEPAAVFEAMQRIFPAHPYGMSLVDSIGGMPLEGGVLVFEIPRMTMANSAASTPFSYTATVVDLLQLHVSLRAANQGQRAACEVTFRGDLRTSTRRNVWAGIGVSGLGGGFGALLGTSASLVAGMILPLAVVAGAVGVACFGAAGAAGYGAMYRYYLRKMIRELETLLKMVDTSARTGGAFRPPQPPTSVGSSDPFTMISS
jgi:hypothetical protein